MKLKQLLVLAIFAAAVALAPAASSGLVSSCALFCASVRCVPESVCGPYVNGSGQTVCGCHPRP